MGVGDKKKTILDNVTLTTTAANNVGVFYIQDYTESTIYIRYTSSTTGNSIQYFLEFSNDGVNYNPEPNETVAAGVATAIIKSRDYVSLGTAATFIPAISMPVNDMFMRILIKETLGGGGAHGTVTVDARRSKLK